MQMKVFWKQEWAGLGKGSDEHLPPQNKIEKSRGIRRWFVCSQVKLPSKASSFPRFLGPLTAADRLHTAVYWALGRAWHIDPGTNWHKPHCTNQHLSISSNRTQCIINGGVGIDVAVFNSRVQIPLFPKHRIHRIQNQQNHLYMYIYPIGIRNADMYPARWGDRNCLAARLTAATATAVAPERLTTSKSDGVSGGAHLSCWLLRRRDISAIDSGSREG